MKTPCPSDELDLLARGALPPLPTQRLLAHLRGCAACRDELAWRRAERLLADEHARRRAPLARALPRGRRPGRVGPLEGAARLAAGRRRRARRARGSGGGDRVVAAAEPAPVRAGRRHRAPRTPGVGGPGPLERAAPITLRELTVARPVARPATLSLSVGEATVDVGPCGGGEVHVTVSDTPHGALALRAQPGPGGRGERVELRADEGSVLESGRAHVLVPRGTRLEVTTSAGEQFVTEVTAPTRVGGAGRPP
jgi:hypothetical protein